MQVKFNKQQFEAINYINGNLAVIATAGSGKTSVLTNRIKNMINTHKILPSSILPITFSRKARDTMEERLHKLGVYNVEVETFHSFAFKIICDMYGCGRFKLWTSRKEKENALRQICKSAGCSFRKPIPYNELLSFISVQKSKLKSPTDKLSYKKGLPYKRKVMAEIYSEYEEYKERNMLIEFDDFFAMALDVLKNNKDILKKYKDRYKYVLVDEFQDVSAPQAKLLKKINTKNTMIVGDPLQAIYSFRGGNSEFILNFDKDYKDVKVINLNTNYRCSKDIVITANALASSIPDSLHRNYVESVAYNSSCKIPQVYRFETDKDEAMWISKKIKELQSDGYKRTDIAVLARTNAQLLRVETALHNANCGFSVVGNHLFFELPEIKLVLAYMRVANGGKGDDSFACIYNKPTRWLSKDFCNKVENESRKNNISYYEALKNASYGEWQYHEGVCEIVKVVSHIRKMKYNSVSEIVSYLRQTLDIDTFVSNGKPSDDGNCNEQIENLDIFEDFCADYSTIEELLTYITDFSKKANKANQDKVHLLTIHRAKGAEYPVVFIIGCNDTILPHYRSEDIDDERRLLYVGITRAEKELYLSYADENARGCMDISPFIKSLKNTVRFSHQTSNINGEYYNKGKAVRAIPAKQLGSSFMH